LRAEQEAEKLGVEEQLAEQERVLKEQAELLRI
jgi:hypothetical protein